MTNDEIYDLIEAIYRFRKARKTAEEAHPEWFVASSLLNPEDADSELFILKVTAEHLEMELLCMMKTLMNDLDDYSKRLMADWIRTMEQFRIILNKKHVSYLEARSFPNPPHDYLFYKENYNA